MSVSISFLGASCTVTGSKYLVRASSGGSTQQVHVKHREPLASDALRQSIERELGWRALAPEHGSSWPG